MLLAQADTTLNQLTAWVVGATGLLALATVVLAALQLRSLGLQRRALSTVEGQLAVDREQLELDRKQIEVTREQLRPHLEFDDVRWPEPGQLPEVTILYVSGSEAASDVHAWMKASDGRRFGKPASTPAPGRPRETMSLDALPERLSARWDDYVGKADEYIWLRDSEWWAAIGAGGLGPGLMLFG